MLELFEPLLMSCVSQDEFEMNMRLLGARNLKEVVPEMVDASSLHSHIVAVPGDRLYDSNCEYLNSACAPIFWLGSWS